MFSLKVYCDSRECSWVGELGGLQRHKAGSCRYTLAHCKYGCGVSLPRHLLRTHERDKCANCPIKDRVEGICDRMDNEFAALEKKYDSEVAFLRETVKEQSSLLASLKLELQNLREELECVKKGTTTETTVGCGSKDPTAHDKETANTKVVACNSKEKSKR